jgi:acetylornithine deacetylase/succinyl-diaminopimelate desuccinylase-like protein
VWRWLLGGLAVVLAAAAVVVAAGGSSDSESARDPVGADLAALQRFADSGGGTRAAGTPGDRATAAYLADRLEQAGYRVTTQAFTVPFYRERRPPRVEVDGRPLREIRTLQFSPAGRATGRIRAVGLGCHQRDFDGLKRGEVALIKRGDCFFYLKALHARRAGAAAALMVNDGPKPTPGSLFRFGPGIPVVGIGEPAGAGLAGHRATVDVDATSEQRETSNVIGEIGPADAPHVVMAGAHRDSVPAGPGLNDDGSGVVALLAMADRFPADRLPPRSALRIAFWGGEELGLLGSRRYVNRLRDTDRARIAAYLNLDMVGSPGAKVAVYDSGDRIEATYRQHLPPNAPQVRLVGDSDHASFEARDIPAGGIFTGLDDCYHQPCDTIENVDRRVLATSIRATEGTLVDLLAR